MSSPEQPSTNNKESIEKKLNLRDQYEAQLAIYEKTGLIQKLSSGKLGIEGIDPENKDEKREYPIPSFEAVNAGMSKQAERLDPKINQGFTKLLLVPIAQPLEDTVELYRKLILQHHADGKLFYPGVDLGRSGPPPYRDSDKDLDIADNPVVSLDENYFYDWSFAGNDVNGKIKYHLQSFPSVDEFNEMPQEKRKEYFMNLGLTKQEVVASTTEGTFPGWEVLMIEDRPISYSRRHGVEPKVVSGRKQLSVYSCSSTEFLKLAKEDFHYKDEQGYTPETWMAQAISRLETHNEIFDENYYSGNTILAGVFLAPTSHHKFESSAEYNSSLNTITVGWEPGFWRTGNKEMHMADGTIRSAVKVNDK